MASQPPRLLFLTGAPIASDVEHSDDELQNTILPSIESFLQGQVVNIRGNSQGKLAAVPKWRSVPSQSHVNLPTFNSGPSFDLRFGSFSRDVLRRPIDPRAVSLELETNESAFPDSVSDTFSNISQNQYLQHSIAFHERLESSQIEPQDSQTEFGAMLSFSSTFQNQPSHDISISAPQNAFAIRGNDSYIPIQLPSNLPITPLGLLPSAGRLDALYPQTLTPNLVVVVTSLSPPRSVFTRANRMMMLYDIQVADETGSDFTVTFWLPPHPISQEEHYIRPEQHNQLRIALDYLFSGDIILLRYIALSHFRGVVHGQSLNPHISRARTAVHVLVRAGADQLPICHLGLALREKVERVKLWVKQFVSANIIHRTEPRVERKAKRKRDDEVDQLPPDTQVIITLNTNLI